MRIIRMKQKCDFETRSETTLARFSSVLSSNSHKSSPAGQQGQFDYSLLLRGPLRSSSIEKFEFTWANE